MIFMSVFLCAYDLASVHSLIRRKFSGSKDAVVTFNDGLAINNARVGNGRDLYGEERKQLGHETIFWNLLGY